LMALRRCISLHHTMSIMTIASHTHQHPSAF
jgi:hypothetical protein